MKFVIQRVETASVFINEESVGKINQGLLIYVGFTHDDNEEKVLKAVRKILNLRIFSDTEDKMNLSIKDVFGKILLISQFTLYANLERGNRPSFTDALLPTLASDLYDKMIAEFSKEIEVESGVFGENMQIDSVNDGPVTIIYVQD